MADALQWISTELERLAGEQLVRRRRVVHPLPDGWCDVDGRRLRNFASNDYLGLAGDERLLAAARGAMESAGAGARASPLVCGRSEWHERLETRLAAFEGAAAAILFPTGYAANAGTIAALVGRGDVVIGDRLNHASLIDGCRLSRADVRIYPHRDVVALDQELGKHAGARRKLIVTDGVFSMDGDLAPLRELVEVAERHTAMLLVDEAHGTGVWGPGGRGACEELHIEDRAIRIGTLSKAVGAQGGFVVGSRSLVDWLWHSARPQVFSTALAPACCAAALAAIEIIEQEPDRRTRLMQRGDQLRTAFLAGGVEPLPGSRGPIVPIVIGDAGRTMHIGRELEECGFLVGTIRPPTVPPGSARLRISLSAVHTAEDVQELARAVVAAITEHSRG